MATNPAAAAADELAICRICLSDENQDDMVSPCNCRGSVSHVHAFCLNKWRTMQNPASYKKVVCQICRSPYRVVHGGQAFVYRAVVRLVSMASMLPIGLLAAEIVPGFPMRTSREVDIFGFDVEEWSSKAFAWALSEDDLACVSAIVRHKGGAWTLLRAGARVWPILVFGLAKAGSLGVLTQFFLANFAMGGGGGGGGPGGGDWRIHHPPPPPARGGGGEDDDLVLDRAGVVARLLARLSPGQSMLLHYVFYCFALRCCQTPKTPRNAMAFMAMCGLGCWFEVSMMESLIRRVVLRFWPDLEVARLAPNRRRMGG